ncbi:type VI secretion system baseplate subunit TssG [Sphingomonas sp. NFR15]|uniref:type VI secretion system baseplate subunit TssG n=1 Tax=Sphingomonas sp. NFR15 TaxID=1566282 RepID=UPI0008876207|nr:type VI secretion system baseplate subunit TssG [Sphingomonas sp. NFR15]SDA24798.1 type VI secretion system protein ImpH [Sphingomonas sp. NFR15]
MARTSRPPSDHLSLLARAAPHVDRLAPLALLRAVEARAPGLPRIGHSKMPSDDVATLAQTPMMAFPAASLSAITVDGARPRIEGYWLGLTGPMGPLPLHLTEFASYERRYARSQPFGNFVDLAAARMLQFFYRAWSAASPAASVDRPDDDHFGDRLAALTGAEEGAAADSPFPARARLRYAALYVSPRSAAAIADAVSDLLRVPARIVENVVRWRDVEPEDRTVLGDRFAGLGQDIVAGGRVQTAQDAFRVVLTLPDARTYAEFLPGGQRFAMATAALNSFAPPHLEWEVELELPASAIAPVRLGGGMRIGWSAWTGKPRGEEARADARLGPSARRIADHHNKEHIS